MSTQFQLPALKPEVRDGLSLATNTAAIAFADASLSGDVGGALDVAGAIQDLRQWFDRPEIKARIIALQDSPIGFRTDHDPKQKNRKTGEYNKPYEWDTVRDCAIEASLRGIQFVGNQFNIISFRMYTTREGFEFLIRRRKEVTEFRPIINVPKTLGGGALVECEATWKQSGVAQALKVTIPVKTDDYSGADQIIGKATRKFLKRCYEMMTGNVLPEGEVGDDHGPAALPEGTPQKSIAEGVAASTAERPKRQAKVEPTPPASTPANAPVAADVEVVADAPAESVLQNRLAAFVAGEGAKFDDFMKVASEIGFLEGDDTNAGAFLELSNALCEKCLKSPKGLKGMLAVVVKDREGK